MGSSRTATEREQAVTGVGYSISDTLSTSGNDEMEKVYQFGRLEGLFSETTIYPIWTIASCEGIAGNHAREKKCVCDMLGEKISRSTIDPE
jgi:hypothetical protein